MKPPQTRLAVPPRLACSLLLAAGLAACAGPRLEVATAPSEASVTLADADVRLTILPNTWRGYPGDLDRYYTPVELRIENDRSDEIQVRFADFLAVDEAQNQYRAVAPTEVARALSGGWHPAWAPQGAAAGWAAAGPPLLARRGPWWPYPFWPHRPWWPHYYPYPYYPYPYYDPYYPYFPARGSGYDILTLGLREGRILPGARVEGFLYLQLATRKANLLTLSWSPVAADGKRLATLSAQFRVLR
jgi:hypothetical protein